MRSLDLGTIDGGKVRVKLDELEAAVQASVVAPGSAGYDQKRSIWNGMIDRRPGAIVPAQSEAQVAAAVRFAARHGLILAVRAGGHNIAGKALCDGGLVIDLRLMNGVEVDSVARTARVLPGATLADVDAATQEHALVVPTGINSTTGIAGLTLGGGFGWTTRKHGLTIDALRGARIVTADGEAVTTDGSENADLFWAIRGGGGNFGVVTRFDFQAMPLARQIYAGLVVHPLKAAREVLAAYQAEVERLPDELTCWAVMRQAPPLPFLSESWHGREVLVLALCYVGDPGEGESATHRLRELGEPIAEEVGQTPFTEWQKTFDPLLGEGARNYWKSHDVACFDAEALDLLVSAIETLPTGECEVFLGHIGGAATRVAADATPWPNRQQHYAVNIHTRWQDPFDDSRCIAWARKLYEAIAPYSMGSRYVNFIPEGDEKLVRDAYGPNWDRLVAIKKERDPANLFRTNFNLVSP